MMRGRRRHLCSAKKIRATLEHICITRLFAPTDTRDAGHRGGMSLQLGSRSECYAVVLEAQPSVNSDPVFRGQDWSADGLWYAKKNSYRSERSFSRHASLKLVFVMKAAEYRRGYNAMILRNAMPFHLELGFLNSR